MVRMTTTAAVVVRTMVRMAMVAALLIARGSSAQGAVVDAELRRAVVDAHNELRGQVDPPAADMMALRWNPELASQALLYARTCAWEHSAAGLDSVGENLYLVSSVSLNETAAVHAWYAERRDYSFANNLCAAGKMCGHYTQLVWATAEEVGCGSHLCPTVKNLDVKNAHVFVCNYLPSGNFEDERPYRVGTPCSKCSGKCHNKICFRAEGKSSIPGVAPDPPGGAPDPPGGAPDPTRVAPDPRGGVRDPPGGAPDPPGGNAATRGLVQLGTLGLGLLLAMNLPVA
uniref:Peptidase inhibitor 16-like n=1 Tax=Petromyzon marinus TaxID=7757 RepID=A0AAJ7UCR6_PETMA|nr:peptidase inhibitor 16-like [Petromyzon marinus]XP_032834072.1 peptidase inhibitor 16-like [Petromyzon marinus]XP_032834073.1 peptidase inhibitor 16-like [Petromyzon marinus]